METPNWADLLSSSLEDLQKAKDEKNANETFKALRTALEALEKYVKGIYSINSGTDLKVAWELLLEVSATAVFHKKLATRATRINRWGVLIKLQMKRVSRGLVENITSFIDGVTIEEEFIEVTGDPGYFQRDEKPLPIVSDVNKEAPLASPVLDKKKKFIKIMFGEILPLVIFGAFLIFLFISVLMLNSNVADKGEHDVLQDSAISKNKAQVIELQKNVDVLEENVDALEIDTSSVSEEEYPEDGSAVADTLQ